MSRIISHTQLLLITPLVFRIIYGLQNVNGSQHINVPSLDYTCIKCWCYEYVLNRRTRMAGQFWKEKNKGDMSMLEREDQNEITNS